jgi:hypothetical protein
VKPVGLQSIHNDRGLSVVGAMMVTATLGIVLFTLVNIVHGAHLALELYQIARARTQLMSLLMDQAGMPAAIRSGLYGQEENAVLEGCVNGGTCIHRSGFQPFRLYYPIVGRMPGTTTLLTSSPLTGTRQRPMRVNSKGSFCDTALTECPIDSWPIQIVTEFEAVCPAWYDSIYDPLRGGEPYFGPIEPAGLVIPAQCPRARFIRVRVRIEPSTENGVISKKALFRAFIGETEVDVQRIVATSN